MYWPGPYDDNDDENGAKRYESLLELIQEDHPQMRLMLQRSATDLANAALQLHLRRVAERT